MIRCQLLWSGCCLQVLSIRAGFPASLTQVNMAIMLSGQLCYSFGSQLQSLPSIQAVLLEGTLHNACLMRPRLGSGNNNLPTLLQSLLGMQHHAGVSMLYLGPLNLSQNELSNSSLYFIKVTLAETAKNSLTTLETRVGLSRQPLPTEEWKHGNLGEQEHPQSSSSGSSGFGTTHQPFPNAFHQKHSLNYLIPS